jgi:methylthioribose-1-phosphate isomerase
MKIRTVDWKNGAIVIIDQTRLPARLVHERIRTLPGLVEAVKLLKVRGAPAIGAAGALGVCLAARQFRGEDMQKMLVCLEKAIAYIASSRPTARNLFWALERMHAAARSSTATAPSGMRQVLEREALKIIEEDRQSCRSIGRHGSRLIASGDSVLTICNAGALATVDYGTALGVLYDAHARGKKLKVYACETRPLLQGARLTAWELSAAGIDVTVVCDNMAAALMSQGKVDMVVTGADRIAANGDTANKIGTYNLAVLCRYHAIPFYVAAPVSTFDLSKKSGKEIVIEERSPDEVTSLYFRKPVVRRGVKVFNPAFDVTPHELITAFITERGIMRSPYRQSFAKNMGRHEKNACFLG